MGICTCKAGKGCSIHFFRRSIDPDKYASDKKEFENKYSSKKKKGSRVPEFEVEEFDE